MMFKPKINLLFLLRNARPTRVVRSLSLSATANSKTAHSISVSVGEQPIVFKTGHVARLTASSVIASQGDSAVLATCVANPLDPESGQIPGGGVPLTVDYRPSAAAVGRIPTNYLRRELGQSDADILTSRIIDRSIRSRFPQNYRRSTQVICKPLSLDDDGDSAVLSINAASVALHLSELNFQGPVAAVRVARLENELIVNPSRKILTNSKFNLLLTGGRDDKTVMLEMDGQEITLDEFESALDKAYSKIRQILDAQDKLSEEIGVKKEESRDISQTTDFLARANSVDNDLMRSVAEICEQKIYYILTDLSHDKLTRDNAIKAVLADLLQCMNNSKHEPAMISSVFSLYVKSQIRDLVLKKGLRVDGRKLDEFRPISIEVDVFKKLHGSCLFQRGQTQVFSTVTFDSLEAAFHPDSISQMLGSQQKKTFMLHYEFPGYATNEISTSRGANRREIGHGTLAEKALKHVIPDEFPYSIRLACQVLESNGSSSMASACGGSVALLDAGVRLKNPVGGVAIGLMTNPERPDEDYRLLTDLMGMEDYAGDMDFKIAGTEKGFTAMQLDVKTSGLTRKQLKESLEVGDRGVKFVLEKMRAAISGPRLQFKPTVPVVEVMSIEHFKRLILFRNGAYNLKLIEAETGVKISQEDDTHVSLFAPNSEKLQQAKDLMQKLFDDKEVKEYPYGKMLHAEIIEMSDRGVMVRLPDGGAPIFIPNARLSNVPIKHPSVAGLQVGQKITIQWLGRDPTTGQIRVSRRTTAGLSSQAVNS